MGENCLKTVYLFNEGYGQSRRLLGGKGAGLCEMTSLKLPVPPGFVITTDVCKSYYANNNTLPKSLMKEVKRKIAVLDKETGKRWKSKTNPLLVSVRSGAAISMPGMMDTVLNLGLNDDTVVGLEKQSGNPRFAWDSYRRFIQLFGKVVFGVDDSHFDDILNAEKTRCNVTLDSELDENSLQNIVKKYKDVCKKQTGAEFPSDPDEQLELAIKAVFASWMGERALVYREKNNITPDIADGTAVNVVTMVFGNMGNDSATGVIFTRNPGNGANQIFGDYLVNAQGEDVVAGTRTPKPVSNMKKELPEAYDTLVQTCNTLEQHFSEPQDIEFTLEQGRFYLLQTRSAKMNAVSMVRTSVEMVDEGLIDKNRAVSRLSADQLEQMLHPSIDTKAAKNHKILAKGIAASPGAASGIVVFDVKKATALGEEGKPVILVREETKPEDVPAFFASMGILTSRGGKTSHAAVVARGMGKPCIVGCVDLHIDYDSDTCTTQNATLHSGDSITIDGSTGVIYTGEVPTISPKITKNFKRLLSWAQDSKRLGIRANADTPEAARLARKYGAQGIGLCRTERMFNAKDRIGLFVDMIMADDITQRNKILQKLQQLQRSDFVKILRAMEGYPVTIRLLDPPLHEFLPDPETLSNKIKTMSKSDAQDTTPVLRRARDLAEVNPMMGHRGVRVGITYPEIYKMQIRAVFEATARLANEKVDARPQIMIPQVGSVEELNYIKEIYGTIKSEMEKRYNRKLSVNFGTMIEVVRAAITANALATTAEFFSFGTNDLTQATYSFSREDAEGKFLPEYMDKEILSHNPFQSLDVDGVGELMNIAISKGRSVNSSMEIGICGEHGGDPNSVKFCHASGISYVSASPHRIPIAMVAAAQAAISEV
ncbi:MAG: pyruvate, phosphate dikinase [Cenarchaeum sp. SB0663_bin_5]|nr:pyruvate, phosphate dikinase [Cenarchaeum sp. SB0663_bin_5]MYH03852.1 pyruvate, phosphate dikinase [Cenarchaeum sp. SB0675_bin_21]MYL11188.1 pyruvate, phosphate dikinase [Cenarchaeum sp. SB0669_bin_11]